LEFEAPRANKYPAGVSFSFSQSIHAQGILCVYSLPFFLFTQSKSHYGAPRPTFTQRLQRDSFSALSIPTRPQPTNTSLSSAFANLLSLTFNYSAKSNQEQPQKQLQEIQQEQLQTPSIKTSQTTTTTTATRTTITMHLIHALAVAGVLPLLVSAHMEMIVPLPINSAKDPKVPDNLKDYSYTAPLLDTGTNFPCKGYHLQETSHVSKATYKAGETAKLEIAGSAVHGGGSCQISLSYDNGATWKVIKSMIGGCPVTTSYDFTIPTDAPSSDDALLAWTWFNLVGNREMYMNCARVTVEGATPPGRHRRAQIASRQGGFSSLPDMFTCNIGQGCKTTEGEAVDFAEPGTDAIKGGAGGAGAGSGSGSGSGAGSGAGAGAGGSGAPTPAAPGSPSSASAPFANATSTAGSPSKPGAAAPSGSNVVIPVTDKPAAPAAPSASAPAPAPAPAAPAAPAAGGSCTGGSIVCDSPSTWSMCVNGALTSMGAVAPGTSCVDGKIGFAKA
jgi:hypothetical protein